VAARRSLADTSDALIQIICVIERGARILPI
jgi:hypothetical protein